MTTTATAGSTSGAVSITVDSSAGSGRCSGPLPTTTSSTTRSGPRNTTITASGPTLTTTSSTTCSSPPEQRTCTQASAAGAYAARSAGGTATFPAALPNSDRKSGVEGKSGDRG